MLKKLLKVIIVSCVFYVIAYQVYSNWDHIRQYDWNINIVCILIAGIFYLLTGVVASLNWLLILKRNGENINFFDSNWNWTMANFGKYVPGKIVQYASRIYLFERLGINKGQTVVYMLLEVIYLIVSAFLVLVIVILVVPLEKSLLSYEMKYIFLSLYLILSVLSLHPFLLAKLVNFLGKLFRREVSVAIRIKFKDSIFLMMVYIAYWLLCGISFGLFVHSFIPVSLSAYVFLLGANTTAYVIGYLSIVFPSGIGVREGFLTYFLSYLLNAGVAGIFSISWRIWGILGEILYFLLSSIGHYRR